MCFDDLMKINNEKTFNTGVFTLYFGNKALDLVVVLSKFPIPQQ